MIEFKGTPAPWRVEREDFENGYCYRLRGSREEHLGDMYGAHREGEEAQYEANAVLVSVAPEMLSMLLKARFWAQMAATPDERRELADLIDKATSNSN